MAKIQYNIGLDIGTSSVGWAVTDDSGHLMRQKGKNMWGVRLFEEAQTAEKRRSYRSTRRRIARRKQRINHLQTIFETEINKMDINFFQRLKESFLQNEDKSILASSILFDDHNYSDTEYHEKYPTIYHLRKELMDSTEKKDIRLVYLALHHILKYRGHFLYGKSDFGKIGGSVNDDLAYVLSNLFPDDGYGMDQKQYDEIVQILSSNNKAADKQDRLQEVLSSKDREINNILKEVIKSILGYKFNLVRLFQLESIQNAITMSFKDEYDETEIAAVVGEKIEVLDSLKSIYSWVTLEELLGNIRTNRAEDKTISNAMIAKYDRHKIELQMLKQLVKDTCPQKEYNDIFRKEGKEHNYTNYIKGTKACSLEELNKYILKIINKYDLIKEHMHYVEIHELLKENKLLAKLNTTDNAVIPYQLHKIELEKIINNQGKYYPFIMENKTLIVKMLECKLPYYVGPLNEHSKFAWLEKNNNKKGIYPWNYEEFIDIDTTAEKFIKRMTNKCTYLKDQDVLPRHSLIYSEFVLLNELNKVKVNGKFIDRDSKKAIIESIFKSKKTVKTEDVIKWIRVNPNGYIISKSDEIIITGTQKENEFASSLTSYYDFKKLFGEINETNIEMIEQIINWITIFEDKQILRKKIKEAYKLEKEIIDRIIKFNYSGWARLSSKLIYGIRSYKDSANYGQTIIEIMRETNQNFMQIINDEKFDFQQIIRSHNPITQREKINYEDIQELQGSPGIKRGIWETVKIIEEIVEIMGKQPGNIFIEFSRSDEASKRTTSRINRMKTLYDEIKKDVDVYNKQGYKETHQLLQGYIVSKNKLDNMALYLYFTQNGKCMYTGKALNPETLSLYQIDHIMPQSYIKDDSIDNLALVTAEANQLKKDNLVLDWEVRNTQKNYWDSLLKNGLISRKKHDNLNRDIIPDREIIGFINRQLVETRQISKHVSELLSEAYEGTNIIAIKAKLVSDYREQYGLYKNRDINDYHHAHDAFISSVIGNFIINRYPKFENEINIKKYIKNFRDKGMDRDHKNKYGFILANMNKDHAEDNFVWDKDVEISKVKKALEYKDCFITKKVKEQKGQFYDETIYGRNNPKARIPLKKGLDPKKYGGYSGVNNAYYVAIEYLKGKRKIKKIISIPLYKTAEIERNGLESYVMELEKIKDKNTLKILKDKVKRYQLVEYQGHRVYLISDAEQQNAVQLLIDNQYGELLYKISQDKILSDPEKLEKYNSVAISFYDYYYEKLKTHYPLYNNLLSDLKVSRKDFISFELEQKVEFVKQLLLITKAGSMSGRFKKFNTAIKKDDAGRIRLKWNINDMVFIDTSVTGLFERRYRL